MLCSCSAYPFGGSRFICRKAAPYALLVSHLRQKCYGVTSGNSPFVILRSAHLFLRFLYRSGTISAPLSARSSTSQQTHKRGACKPHNHVVLSSTYRKTTKSIDFKSQYHLQHRVSCSVYFYFRKFLFRSFVILTTAVIYLKLLSFIATYRQLYKKCYNSLKPRFQAVLTHKFFMRFASRQMIFECAILVIAVKILGRQKRKMSLTFTAA